MDRIHQGSVEVAPGLRPEAPRATSRLKQREGFIAPQERCDGVKVQAGVRALAPCDAEPDLPSVVLVRDVDAPPLRHEALRGFRVARTDYERHAVEHPAVALDLSREAFQRVRVALDLVAVDPAVHDGDVHSHDAALKPELIDHERVGIANVSGQDGRAKRGADIDISHRRGF